jgi:hypothetical protein
MILPALPMDQASKLFCANNGRPTHDLRTLTGKLVLQELFDMIDSQILNAVKFNMVFQRALNVANHSIAPVPGVGPKDKSRRPKSLSTNLTWPMELQN